MALVDCKECGHKISTKAKACPNCGAKPAKKTSLFTWIILLGIVIAIYGLNQGSSKKVAPAASKTSQAASKPETAKKVELSSPLWSTSETVDEMTGVFSAYAVSKTVSPTKRMESPYGDVGLWVGVGCDSKSEWIYFGFTKTPIPLKTRWDGKTRVVSSLVKWDDKIETVELTQEGGSKFLNFRIDAPAIAKLEASNFMLLEIQWYGQQKSHFKFDLEGSANALAEIRAKCAVAKK